MIELLITGWIIGSTYILVILCNEMPNHIKRDPVVAVPVVVGCSWLLWPIMMMIMIYVIYFKSAK